MALLRRVALVLVIAHLAHALVLVLAAEWQLERAEVLDVAHRGGGHGDQRVARMRESAMRKPRCEDTEVGYRVFYCTRLALGKKRRIPDYEAARPPLIELGPNSLVGGGWTRLLDAG